MQAFVSGLVENRALMIVAAAVAFLVAALLILLVFRLAFGRKLRMSGGRSRQPRLGIVDAFDLDGQRQLVLVRRDNVEHLILIGKHTDVLIESEIVRADARDLREPRGRDKELKEPTQLPQMAPHKPVAPGVAAAHLNGPTLAGWEPEADAASAEPAQPPGRIPPMAPPFTAPPERAPMAQPPRRAPMPSVAGAKPLPRTPLAAESVAAEAERRPAPRPVPASPSPQRPAITPPTFLRPQRSPQGELGAIPPQPAPPSSGLQPAAASRAPAPRPPSPAAVRSRAPGPAAAGPPVPPPNMLESLEEEMAKLLGRGTNKP